MPTWKRPHAAGLHKGGMRADSKARDVCHFWLVYTVDIQSCNLKASGKSHTLTHLIQVERKIMPWQWQLEDLTIHKIWVKWFRARVKSQPTDTGSSPNRRLEPTSRREWLQGLPQISVITNTNPSCCFFHPAFQSVSVMCPSWLRLDMLSVVGRSRSICNLCRGLNCKLNPKIKSRLQIWTALLDLKLSSHCRVKEADKPSLTQNMSINWPSFEVSIH